MIYEVVVENIEEIKAAQKMGVLRVELVSNLSCGGLTPSYAAIEMAKQHSSVDLHIMIRPREGGFVYESHELEVMKADIAICAKLGCKGVVFGILTKNNEVDVNATQMLALFAKSLGLEITFHRALDFTNDIFKSISYLTSLDFTRILTSGGKMNVDEGFDNIKVICQEFKGIIEITAGGGVNASNIDKLSSLDIDGIHFNIKKEKHNFFDHIMGKEYDIDTQKLNTIMSNVRNNI